MVVEQGKWEDIDLHKLFEQEIEIANKDIDLMPEQEDYMRGYLGGILCAYRIVFGKNYEESEGENLTLDDWTYHEYPRESEEEND